MTIQTKACLINPQRLSNVRNQKLIFVSCAYPANVCLFETVDCSGHGLVFRTPADLFQQVRAGVIELVGCARCLRNSTRFPESEYSTLVMK